jgi:hypothetical protein
VRLDCHSLSYCLYAVPDDSSDYEEWTYDYKFSDDQDLSYDAPLDHSPITVFDSPGVYDHSKLDGSKFC